MGWSPLDHHPLKVMTLLTNKGKVTSLLDQPGTLHTFTSQPQCFVSKNLYAWVFRESRSYLPGFLFCALQLIPTSTTPISVIGFLHFKQGNPVWGFYNNASRGFGVLFGSRMAPSCPPWCSSMSLQCPLLTRVHVQPLAKESAFNTYLNCLSAGKEVWLWTQETVNG